MPQPHFSHLARLLKLEAQAEAEQLRDRVRRLPANQAEKSGLALVGLAIRDEEPGLAGRAILTLGKRNRDLPLPWTRLSVGSPVLLTEEGDQSASHWRGVVCGRSSDAIRVALPESPEPAGERPTFRLDQASDEISRQRQLAALTRAERAERGRLAQLRDMLLGERELATADAEPLTPIHAGLNASQQEAVAFALAAPDLAVIHGPPGTGKTTTVAELIAQAVARGHKVLACAASNLGVDNLLERLIRGNVRAVRLGHPARVLPELQEHTLDVLVDRHPDLALVRKLVREARQLRDRAARFTRAKPAPGEKAALRQEARERLADARRLEQQVVDYLLDSADVLCATLTGLDDELLGGREFDLVVIDEAAQATEPAAWIPLLRGRRLVLAGDHCQLPPTIVSPEAAREGLAVSLQERVVKRFGSQVARLLATQYRMHAAIMRFSSAEFYGGALQADASVAAHRLCDLPGVIETDATASPLSFIDTAGAGYDEELEPDGESRRNPQEADVALAQAQALLEAGVPAGEIALICPYAAQARLLRERAAGLGLEIDTVDGFQGREKEAVIVSLVRSNPRSEVGFLADERRMNVALTRARRRLVVIGDSATIGGHPFYARLLAHFEQEHAYGTVWG